MDMDGRVMWMQAPLHTSGVCVCQLAVKEKGDRESAAGTRVSILRKTSIESISDIQYIYIFDNTGISRKFINVILLS